MGPQILWARLEVLGPDDDGQEKEKEGRKKNKVSLSSFFGSLPAMLIYLSPWPRYPLLVP